MDCRESLNFGRRTGTNIVKGKNIRKDVDGYDVFEDYWTDDDSEDDDTISSSKSDRKRRASTSSSNISDNGNERSKSRQRKGVTSTETRSFSKLCEEDGNFKNESNSTEKTSNNPEVIHKLQKKFEKKSFEVEMHKSPQKAEQALCTRSGNVYSPKVRSSKRNNAESMDNDEYSSLNKKTTRKKKFVKSTSKKPTPLQGSEVLETSPICKSSNAADSEIMPAVYVNSKFSKTFRKAKKLTQSPEMTSSLEVLTSPVSKDLEQTERSTPKRAVISRNLNIGELHSTPTNSDISSKLSSASCFQTSKASNGPLQTVEKYKLKAKNTKDAGEIISDFDKLDKEIMLMISGNVNEKMDQSSENTSPSMRKETVELENCVNSTASNTHIKNIAEECNRTKVLEANQIDSSSGNAAFNETSCRSNISRGLLSEVSLIKKKSSTSKKQTGGWLESESSDHENNDSIDSVSKSVSSRKRNLSKIFQDTSKNQMLRGLSHVQNSSTEQNREVDLDHVMEEKIVSKSTKKGYLISSKNNEQTSGNEPLSSIYLDKRPRVWEKQVKPKSVKSPEKSKNSEEIISEEESYVQSKSKSRHKKISDISQDKNGRAMDRSKIYQKSVSQASGSQTLNAKGLNMKHKDISKYIQEDIGNVIDKKKRQKVKGTYKNLEAFDSLSKGNSSDLRKQPAIFSLKSPRKTSVIQEEICSEDDSPKSQSVTIQQNADDVTADTQVDVANITYEIGTKPLSPINVDTVKFHQNNESSYIASNKHNSSQLKKRAKSHSLKPHKRSKIVEEINSEDSEVRFEEAENGIGSISENTQQTGNNVLKTIRKSKVNNLDVCSENISLRTNCSNSQIHTNIAEDMQNEFDNSIYKSVNQEHSTIDSSKNKVSCTTANKSSSSHLKKQVKSYHPRSPPLNKINSEDDDDIPKSKRVNRQQNVTDISKVLHENTKECSSKNKKTIESSRNNHSPIKSNSSRLKEQSKKKSLRSSQKFAIIDEVSSEDNSDDPQSLSLKKGGLKEFVTNIPEIVGDSKDGKQKSIEKIHEHSRHHTSHHSLNSNLEDVPLDMDLSVRSFRSPKGNKKKRKKKVMSKDEALNTKENTRRSSRQRYAPLDHWRNERLCYRFEKGEIKILGIAEGTNEDKVTIKQLRVKKSERTKARNSKRSKVYDIVHDKNVKLNLLIPYSSVPWDLPSNSADSSSFRIKRTYSTITSAFGFIEIMGLEQKPAQYMPEEDLQMIVLKGHIEVVIQENKFETMQNDMFIVPRGSAYSMKNLLKSKALLSFVVGKFKVFESVKMK